MACILSKSILYIIKIKETTSLTEFRKGELIEAQFELETEDGYLCFYIGSSYLYFPKDSIDIFQEIEKPII